MKKRNVLIVIAAIFVVVSSCEKEDNLTIDSISGVYTGTIEKNSNTKGSLISKSAKTTATAIVTPIIDEFIKVHITSSMIDTTFTLNYYEHNDSVMVCLTGDDFENIYGHMLGDGHMGSNMMGDITNGQTNWMHHLNDEHQTGDEHFGGFNIENHSFGYRIKIMDGGNPFYWNFQGEIK
jgi:ABC-type phosphate transport system substrate-binding protein